MYIERTYSIYYSTDISVEKANPEEESVFFICKVESHFQMDVKI